MGEKKKKYCKTFQNLRLTAQVCCELIIVAILFSCFILFLLGTEIYLISTYMFKILYNNIDVEEFNELTFMENKLENSELQFENTFKDTLLSIVHLYKDFSSLNTLIKNENKNFSMAYYYSMNPTDINPNKTIIYFCKDKFNCNNNDSSSLSLKYPYKNNDIFYYTYLGIYLEKIFSQKKIFMTSDNTLMYQLLIIDYYNEVNLYYPGYYENIKTNITIQNLKKYAIKKAIENVKLIAEFQEIFPHNMDIYDNIFLLPFYDENLFLEGDNQFNITLEIFNNNLNISVKEVAFMFLPRYDSDNRKYMEINMETLSKELENSEKTELIDKIFFLIGIESTKKVIYDKNTKYTTGLSLILNDYLFPYPISNKEYCYNALFLGLKDDDPSYKKLLEETDQDKLVYLDECFDKKTKLFLYEGIKELKDLSLQQNFFMQFDLFQRDDIDFYLNPNKTDENLTYFYSIATFYKTIEKKFLLKNSTSFNKTITKLSVINNQIFKVKKSYSPLNIIYQVNYFYPIDTIKMHFLIKSEGFGNYIALRYKKIRLSVLTTGMILLLMVCFFLFIIYMIILYVFTGQLKKPVMKLNDPSFITNTDNSKNNKNSKNAINKVNTGPDEGIDIDEFKDLIRTISEMVKGEMDLKQQYNKEEEDEMKLELENFNKEFEKNKIFNIMVEENKIKNILEESNYSNEIIKRKINVEKLREDIYVKKSNLYRELAGCENIDYNENSNDYGENSSMSHEQEEINEPKNIFKDKKTLQNPNALVYDLFKMKFDKEYINSLRMTIAKEHREAIDKIREMRTAKIRYNPETEFENITGKHAKIRRSNCFIEGSSNDDEEKFEKKVSNKKNESEEINEEEQNSGAFGEMSEKSINSSDNLNDIDEYDEIGDINTNNRNKGKIENIDTTTATTKKI